MDTGWLCTGMFIFSCTLITGLLEGMRRAKQRVKNKQLQLEFALNAARQGYWILNLETYKAERSLLHDQIFGYTSLQPEWTYEKFLSHIHPDDYQTVIQLVKNAIENKLPWEFQCRIYKVNDNNISWIWAAGQTVAHAKDKLMIGVVQDITEQKKSEDAKAILHAIIEYSEEAIIGKYLNGTIFCWNKGAERLYGYTESEVLGKNIKMLFPPDQQDAFEHIIKAIEQVGYIKHLETTRVHKDGHLIPVSLTISPIKNDCQEIIGISTTARDITQQKLMEEKLRHLAEHDALTGLINKTLFKDRIIQAMTLAKRQKCSIAVCFLDLDNFKQVNDIHGHEIGDLLLQAVTQRLQTCLRESDTLSRLGGDEFGLILQNINEEHDAAKIANLIKHRFSDAFMIKNKRIHIQFSIGISLYPRDSDEFQVLIEKADSAMYDVKNQGKNNFKLFNDPL